MLHNNRNHRYSNPRPVDEYDEGCGILGLAIALALMLAVVAIIVGVIAIIRTKNNVTVIHNYYNESNNCTIVCNSTNVTGNSTAVVLPPIEFANFFALMPGDNAATVALGAGVSFPQLGPENGASIFPINPTTFQITNVGIYDISFTVSVSEPGQLQLKLNAAPFAGCVSGRATGTSIITMRCFVSIVTPNSVISVINPPGNSGALTITPIAGGATAVSAHLNVLRLS